MYVLNEELRRNLEKERFRLINETNKKRDEIESLSSHLTHEKLGVLELMWQDLRKMDRVLGDVAILLCDDRS